MRRITTLLFAAGIAGSLATGCNSDSKTYTDAEYIMFTDTLSTNRVFPDEAYFAVPIASTVACDYDRTFAVEVIDQGSTAIEGYHYRLKSNTITIKAGERTAKVEVAGYYDHIQDTDSLGFKLRLLIPDQTRWNLYADNDQTKVVLYKGCNYDLDTFCGWCVVTSMLLYDYPSALDQNYQRLIFTEKHPTEPNTIILHDFLYNGYDVTMKLTDQDPNEPVVEMDEDQVLSDEQTVFGQINADDKILGTVSPYYDSYYNTCQKSVALWLYVYLKNIGTMVGTVGHFYNVLEWVSLEEAVRLKTEENISGARDPRDDPDYPYKDQDDQE
ncbi:MAG TPA: DUF4984 domain-containing protein [Candidatus Alistipes intestinigallinarum]|uniref:DUF4984 domain-containing protein n=1 Tax=Candidatus Alistipes intestinigallinarum TaxID=2838440 RepID=A0A9D1YZP0_9BACT|nr:DUF4984 domain-containing protein [Candidatus Alistipes intestinigallinarum]